MGGPYRSPFAHRACTFPFHPQPLAGKAPTMSIATKTGDRGTTALMFGHRVPKTDPRIAANGAVDELNAALGMARAFCPDEFVTGPILAIQKELVTLMGEIGVAPED